ncbi:PD-(D/E)XK nuclease superfamily [uncultured Caudovirales phage]|uniref:PD-(D/E)XK nuclease superfamily n=1 Tax=uncultured Caudovirales phage TaxID=2100421 RepID=A0A6J5M131_9CAUD|nr:PD-(D/E)XK nuclease superfamily [uncultured Caudovirales phage]
MNNYIIDLPNKQMTFLDSRFYATDSGGYVPSVTTILDAYPKGAAYYEWLKKNGEDSDTIRDEAGRRGSVVHNLTERYDLGEEINLMDENGYISYKLNEWAMFERYVEFRSRYPLEIIEIEKNIISERLGFAGTLDRIINLNGERILVDIKTSNAIYASYWLQLAAYKELLLQECGEEVDEVAILWLNAKTRTEGKKGQVQGIGWQMVSRNGEETEKDWKLFKATQQLWLAENETARPKRTTYQITHKL